MNLLKRVAAVVGFAGVVLVSGLAANASAPRQTATADVVRIDDNALQTRIDARLKASSALATRHIDVDVADGIVTLTGAVRTSADKASAGRLANVRGVTRVSNQIEVNPKIDRSRIDAAGDKTKSGLTKAVDATVAAARKTKGAVQKGVAKSEEGTGKGVDKTADAVGAVGDKLSDASVSTRVKAGFSGEKLLRDTSVDVDTTDNVVTLKGTVRSDAAKTRAGEIASGTDNVTRVINQLVVEP